MPELKRQNESAIDGLFSLLQAYGVDPKGLDRAGIEKWFDGAIERMNAIPGRKLKSQWDGERIQRAVEHLIEEIGPEYDVSVDVKKETRACGETDGFVDFEIMPGSEKAIVVIRPKVPTLGGRDK